MENSSPLIDEIAGLVGEASAMRLIEHYGGRTICLSRLRGEVGRLVGREAAQKLAFHFNGVGIYIPMEKARMRARRDAALVAHFDELTESGQSARRTVIELATEFRMTERHVWRILKKPSTPSPMQQRTGTALKRGGDRP